MSYEIFLPLINRTKEKFRIIAAEVDGFTLGKHTRFTSVDDQAAQVIEVFDGMNHGQLLVDHPDEVAKRITDLIV